MADEQQQAPEVSAEDTKDSGAEVNFKGDPSGSEAPKEPEAKVADDAPPEGFESWKAYAESLKANADKPKEGEDAAKADTPEAQIEAAISALPEDKRDAGKAIIEAATATGDLTDEQKAEAASIWNVPPAFVDTYLNGLKGEAASVAAPFYEAAGGEDVYKQFSSWAKEGGLSADEIAAFDKGLDTDPVKTIKEATAKWRAAGGGEALDVTRSKEGGRETAAVEGYGSEAEMIRDMNDPRYANDPAFRASVERKVSAAKY